jgi:putative Holliday junction resolvase
MSRILAIDYGTKRVGLAVTDPLGIFATALTTVSNHELMDFIKKYDAQEHISAFVLGMPTRINGADSHATQHVIAFEKFLKRTFPDKPIHLIDERFTSSSALYTMIQGGVKKKDRQVKGNIDKVSATIILQSFLEKKAFIEERIQKEQAQNNENNIQNL